MLVCRLEKQISAVQTQGKGASVSDGHGSSAGGPIIVGLKEDTCAYESFENGNAGICQAQLFDCLGLASH